MPPPRRKTQLSKAALFRTAHRAICQKKTLKLLLPLIEIPTQGKVPLLHKPFQCSRIVFSFYSLAFCPIELLPSKMAPSSMTNIFETRSPVNFEPDSKINLSAT